VKNGICVSCTNLVKNFVTLLRFAHAPTRINGRCAFSIKSIILLMLLSSASGLLGICTSSGVYPDASSLAISSASSICTAHGLSASAVIHACAIVLGTLDASMILVQYLVTGFIMLTTSITWKRPCFVFLMGFCPVMTMTGMPHSCANAIHVIILVAPGHSVAIATHIFPVSLPYVAAINTADCSLRVTMRSIGEVLSASTISKFSSHGTP